MIQVLLAKNCGWGKHGDLLAIHHGLKGGTQGHLCLAKANISANKTVHRFTALHIQLDLIDGLLLIRGFRKGKGVLKLLLPLIVR